MIVASGLAVTAWGQMSELRGGWAPMVPYQFELTGVYGDVKLTGLDIEITKAAALRAGYRLVFRERSWDENLRAVQAGELDFGMAATPVESRKEWAWFSVPYRKEIIGLVVRSDGSGLGSLDHPVQAVQEVLVKGGRVGAIRGFYLGPEMTPLLAQPEVGEQVVLLDNDAALLDALVSKAVDVIVADRLAVVSTAWESDRLGEITFVGRPVFETPISLIFPKPRCRRQPFRPLTTHSKNCGLPANWLR